MPHYPKITKTNKIKYDSPSGYVKIGKYIPPFEKVKEGFGFTGVVVEDAVSGQLQCHICGGWYENFSSHLHSKHKITSNEYKDKFGLSRSTALKSKRIRLRQSEVMIGMRKKHKKHRMKFERNNLFASNRKGKPKSKETVNKYGVCDLQVMDKILKLREKLGKTPTLIDIKNEYGGGFLFQIHKRYNSYVQFCRDNGFDPVFSNHNPKYSREYFIEKGLSNEPSIRILTTNEGRALYKYFKGGVNEWKEEVEKVKAINCI